MSSSGMFRIRRRTPPPTPLRLTVPARQRLDGALSRAEGVESTDGASGRVASPVLGTAPKSLFEDDDLDKFYFQQILDSITDESLQHKIDLEIKIRDGTTKLLSAAQHPKQLLEGAKSLVVSEQRMKSYSEELQKQKRDLKRMASMRQVMEKDQVPCRAKVSISDLRIPLLWRSEDFRMKNDKNFAAFCLLRIGSQVCDTALKTGIDRRTADISFDDLLIFDRVPHDFECHVEVYAFDFNTFVDGSWTPTRLRRKFSEVTSTVGRSVGKKLVKRRHNSTSGGTTESVGPRFSLVARAKIRLDDVEDDVRSHNLTKETADGVHALPLFGQLCCRFAAQPFCLVKPTMEGYLSMMELGRRNGKSCWSEYWCRLSNLRLSCWTSKPKAVAGQPPYLEVPVTKSTQVSLESARCDGRPGFVLKASFAEGGVTDSTRVAVTPALTEFVFATENFKSQSQWWAALQQHLLDQVSWRHACDSLLSVLPQDSSFTSSVSSSRRLAPRESKFVRSASQDHRDASPRETRATGECAGQTRKLGWSISSDAEAKREAWSRGSGAQSSLSIYDALAIDDPPRCSSSMQISTYDNVSFSGRSTPLHSSITHSRTPTPSTSPFVRSTPPTTPSFFRATPPPRRKNSGDSGSATKKTSLSSFPSLDEEAIEELLLKYTNSSNSREGDTLRSTMSSGSRVGSSMGFGSRRKINDLFSSLSPRARHWVYSN